MIIIDDRVFEKYDLNESEFWFLMKLTKRLRKNGISAFPSNATLMKDTGWKIDKLRQVKNSLIKKKVIRKEEKFANNGRQKSNTYSILIDEIKFTFSIQKNGLAEETVGGVGKTDTLLKNQGGEGSEKPIPLRGSEKQTPHYIEPIKEEVTNNSTLDVEFHLFDFLNASRKELEKRIGKKHYDQLFNVELDEKKAIALGKWLAYRSKILKKNYKSLKAVVNLFRKNSIAALEWAVEKSITNEWQGLFPENFKEPKNAAAAPVGTGKNGALKITDVETEEDRKRREFEKKRSLEQEKAGSNKAKSDPKALLKIMEETRNIFLYGRARI